MRLVDTHAHLDFPEYEPDLALVLSRAQAVGVELIINIGIDEESSRRSVEMAHTHSLLRATVGVHPHAAAEAGEGFCDELARLAAAKEVVAIGETGLDYYRDRSPREVQQRVFRQQICLARETGLPLVIHSRYAFDDTLAILAEEGGGEVGGVIHCFSGDWETAQRFLAMGFHIALGGVVTFPAAAALQEVARRVPLDRLLLETDCPFLAPQSHRGQRNEPAYIEAVAAKIAVLRGAAAGEVARQTTDNARVLFPEVAGITQNHGY